MGLEKERRVIKLPDSGEEITVRRLSSMDWQLVGGIPDTILPTFMKMVGKPDGGLKDMDTESAIFLQKVMLRGIVKQSGKLKLVIKDPQECGENEISFVDLTDEDQGTLMSNILEGGAGIPFDFHAQTSGEVGKNSKRKRGQ